MVDNHHTIVEYFMVKMKGGFGHSGAREFYTAHLICSLWTLTFYLIYSGHVFEYGI